MRRSHDVSGELLQSEYVKLLTRSEAETKRQQAVELMRRLGKDEEADTFDGMSTEEYADHRGVQLLQNPNLRTLIMAKAKTAAQLKAELVEANDYIEQLEAKLDNIVGIAQDEDNDEEEEDDEDEYLD